MSAGGEPAFARPPRGEGRLVAGVSVGLAQRWELSPHLVRAGFVVATFAYGAGVLLYAALALAMPARGASAVRIERSAQAGRTLLSALRGVAALGALSLLAASSAALALFGLGSVALLLACGCVVALLLRMFPAAAPLGAAAVALTLPAALVTLGDVELAPHIGERIVELRNADEVDPAGYRAGTGPLLVDLRRFSAPKGSVTTIRARADLERLVVALPRRRCFALVIDQQREQRWLTDLLDGPEPPELGAGRRSLPRQRRLARSGEPVLHLVLATGGAQTVIRTFSATSRPLDESLGLSQPRRLDEERC